MGKLWVDTKCPFCKRRHIVTLQKCPECGVYETPQPAFKAVAEKCQRDYACEGCQAYRDHLR